MADFPEESSTFIDCSNSSTMNSSQPNVKPNRQTRVKGWNDISFMEYLKSQEGQEWFRKMMNQSIDNLNSKNGTNIPSIEVKDQPKHERK